MKLVPLIKQASIALLALGIILPINSYAIDDDNSNSAASGKFITAVLAGSFIASVAGITLIVVHHRKKSNA